MHDRNRNMAAWPKQTLIWIYTGVGDNRVIIAHNAATVNFSCTASNGRIPPNWFVNGTVVYTNGDRYRTTSSMDSTGNPMNTLTINGNQIPETWNIHCEVWISEPPHMTTLYGITLVFQG